MEKKHRQESDASQRQESGDSSPSHADRRSQVRGRQARLAALRGENLGGGGQDKQQGAQEINFGDDEGSTMEVRPSADDGSVHAVDVEAEQAKNLLRLKINNTRNEVIHGITDAATKPQWQQAEELKEEAQAKVVELLTSRYQEKAKSWAGAQFKQAAVKGGGAAAKGMKDHVAGEAAHMAGKVAGAISAVGEAKEVLDGIEDAAVAELRATTLAQFSDQAIECERARFEDFDKRVNAMSAEDAIAAAKTETPDPWIHRGAVTAALTGLIGEALIQSGELHGKDERDAVQQQLHPMGTGEDE